MQRALGCWSHGLGGLLSIASPRTPIHICRTLSIPLLMAASVRRKSYYATIDEDNPQRTLETAEETINRLRSKGMENSTEHLLININIALAYYQMGDYRMAKEKAVWAHETLCEHRGHNGVHTFFSAKTAARCCRALRLEYLKYLENQDRNPVIDELAPRKHKAHSPEAIVIALEKEEKTYDAHARRIYAAPRNSFMRGSQGWNWSDDSTYGANKTNDTDDYRYSTQQDESPWDPDRRKRQARHIQRSARESEAGKKVPK